MEQQIAPDFGGRRSGIDRRALLTEMPFESDRRTGQDRRTGFERRLQARFVSGGLKNINAIKFERPSRLGKIFSGKRKRGVSTNSEKRLQTVTPGRPRHLKIPSDSARGSMTPDELNAFTGNHIKLLLEDKDLDFETAKDLAMQKAKELTADPMLLSWYSGKTGEYYPKTECGRTDKPVWIVFAESRGADIAININDGEYIFLYLSV